MWPLLFCLAVTSCLISRGLAGNYLFYMPVAFKSMKISFMPIVSELAARGHHVMVISPFQNKQPIEGVTEIINDSSMEFWNNHISKMALEEENTVLDYKMYIDLVVNSTRSALNLREVQDLVKNPAKMDVVVVCCTIFGDESGYFLAHKFNASLVLLSSKIYSQPWINWATGNPYNPSYMPIITVPQMSKSQNQLDFSQRLFNSVLSMIVLIMRNWFIYPPVLEVVREAFPDEDIPDLLKVEETAALSMFAGNTFLGDGLRPTLPNVLQVGMMRCVKRNELPHHIQEWIDGAEHGVIYISFGSILKPSLMKSSQKQVFLSVLSSLPQRIVWKWEGDLQDKPANVLTSSWFPQPDILGHPNVKLFITHGGAGSLQDAICHKTPMVGIPLSADQMTNLEDAKDKGVAEVLQWKNLTVENLHLSILQVLQNQTYQDRSTELGDLVMDFPQHPVDTAVWWMEYLLRHPGNTGMRSPAMRLAWWQYFLLDVGLLLLLVLLVVVVAPIFIIKCCLRCIRKHKVKKD